jgi:hypothetical protein
MIYILCGNCEQPVNIDEIDDVDVGDHSEGWCPTCLRWLHNHPEVW